MKLFYTPNSPYARKCRVVAIEKGLSQKIKFIQSDPWENVPELLAANPLAKVPALVTDNGMAICDSPIICEYLDSLSPEPRLLPADTNDRIEVLGVAALADGIIDDAVAWVIETMRRPADKRWDGWITRKENGVKRTIALIAPHASDDDPLSLATINLAVALAYVSFRMPHINWRADHPQLANWLDNFSARESMRQTQPIA
jgi:glutathione S-transferase